MENPFDLTGETALVTGGGTGIGLAISRCLANAGAKVCITGRREDVLASAAAEISSDATFYPGDVNSPADRAAMLARVEKTFGAPVSLLVNNAGQNVKNPALDVTDEAFDELLATHVKAGFALARDAAPAMLSRGRGSILFIASMASYMGVPKIAGYTTAKTAVLGLVRSLASEWSAQGVRVNAIAPGWISTPMTDKAFSADPARREKVISRTPMAKMGRPEDIGNAAVFLCSPAASFITGQCLPVDGGASIGF